MPDAKPLHLGHIDCVGDYEPGDPRPEGYRDWHEWARVQVKAGLRQKQCCKCSKWKFPQELSDEIAEHDALTGHGVKVHLKSAVCLECQRRHGKAGESK